MAAIRCYENAAKEGPVRPLKIYSFENDLHSLELAFRHSDKFRYLRHSGPAWILREGSWRSKEWPELSWELVRGDFLETVGRVEEPPEIIFYDMFSRKTCADQWTLATFEKLFRACAGGAASLFTYSCSTAARGCMLASGFHVARGKGTGQKLETTVAFTPRELVSRWVDYYEILGAEWLGKWERSRARIPEDLEEARHAEFERRIREHPQFSSTASGQESAGRPE
jgi:queuine tRNA-ribosyltransferase